MTYAPATHPAQQQDAPRVSPTKALHKVISEQRPGRMTITDPVDPSIGWRVYFGDGQIHFAESTVGRQDRLPYVLRQHFPDLAPMQWSEQGTSDYPLLCQLWQSQGWPLNHFRQMLALLTQEALIQMLAIPQAALKYETKIGLDPLLLSAPFRQLVLPMRDTLTRWTQLRPQVSSPLQRLQLVDRNALLNFIWTDKKELQFLQDAVGLLEENLSLYQLAFKLKQDVQTLAIALHPLIAHGVITATPYRQIQASNLTRIACVDDSKTIQQFVKFALESSGYEVLPILDPTHAVSALADAPPQLILMDIEMPHMDGYELCRRVRQIDAFKEIPIVMLTGREGIIDRVRARMSGCSAYLTKPFNPQELLALIQKMTSSPDLPDTI